MFYALLLVAGLGFPVIAAVFGVVFLIGRVWYMFSYSADAKKRGKGFLVSTLGNLGLLCVCIAFAVQLGRGVEPY